MKKIIRRSSKHILKYQTETKSGGLDLLFDLYKKELENFIHLIWTDILPLRKNLSSKDLEGTYIQHSQWLQVIYKQASEIVRSQRKNKKKTYPVIKNIGINIDNRLFDIQNNSKEFDGFIKLRLPIFYQNKHLAISVNLPYKEHKHSLKYKDWDRNKTIKLTKEKDKYYIHFSYSKEIEYKETGENLGLDIGVNKLFVTSDGKMYGTNVSSLLNKIVRRKRKSKNYKQTLIERTNEFNKICNDLDLSEINTLFIEDLKNLKKGKKKRSTKFRNKIQYWNYAQVINKLEMFCEENGVHLIKVNPAYTSQICSKCGATGVRENESFTCEVCGNVLDADYNASLNILHRGVYNPSIIKELEVR